MAMLNPCHPGEILRDNLEAAELSVTDAAARLGCTRQAMSRLLNGKAGDLAGDGHCVGAPRLERRGLLDAPSGGLRTGAGAAPAGGLSA